MNASRMQSQHVKQLDWIPGAALDQDQMPVVYPLLLDLVTVIDFVTSIVTAAQMCHLHRSTHAKVRIHANTCIESK